METTSKGDMTPLVTMTIPCSYQLPVKLAYRITRLDIDKREQMERKSSQRNSAHMVPES
jgi:hypothetical protein